MELQKYYYMEVGGVNTENSHSLEYSTSIPYVVVQRNKFSKLGIH